MIADLLLAEPSQSQAVSDGGGVLTSQHVSYAAPHHRHTETDLCPLRTSLPAMAASRCLPLKPVPICAPACKP